MKKKDLIREVSQKTALSKKDIERVIDSMSELTLEELRAHGTMRVPGLGIFNVHNRPTKKSSHPVTGEVVVIPSRMVVSFKTGKSLKSDLNS